MRTDIMATDYLKRAKSRLIDARDALEKAEHAFQTCSRFHKEFIS